MKLIRNLSDFQDWKDRQTAYDDIVHPPERFPCYAYKTVTNWTHEQETANYLYLDDLEDMLKSLT